MLPRPPSARRRGSVSILCAVAAFVLIGLVGLTVDTAWVMTARQQLQAAADAAALAGAARLSSTGSAQPVARAAALSTALANRVVGCCPNGVLLDPNPSNDPNGDVVVGRWKYDDS